MTRKPAHTGPFDLESMRSILRAASQQASDRARREERDMVVYLVRDCEMGGGAGCAVRPADEPIPEGFELHAEFPAPAPLTDKQNAFYRAYLPELLAELERDPLEYAWPKADAPRVARAMVRGLTTGTANKDSNAIRRACRKLGIAYTYKGLKEALQ